MMSIVNSIAGAVVSAALFPFRGLPPLIGLAAFSLLSGVAMLYVFKWTSDQPALDIVKRRIHAGIFEMRLFHDDLFAVFAAQRDILANNLRYLRLSLRPLVFMLVPFVLIVAQLQINYGYAGPEVGEPVIVTVTLADDGVDEIAAATRPAPAIELDTPAGLRRDSERVWAPRLNQAAWRIVAEAPGSYQLGVRVDDAEFTKSVRVGDRLVPRPPIRSASFLDRLLYPGEPGFPAGAPVAAIEVMYPERNINFLGWSTHWLVPFLIITIALAFALRKPLGVTL